MAKLSKLFTGFSAWILHLKGSIMQDCGALCKTILLHFYSRYASIQIIYFNFFFCIRKPLEAYDNYIIFY